MRNRLFLFSILLCLLLCAVPALGAEQPTILVVPGSTVLDLGSTQVSDWDALKALIDQTPGLKEVHLYENEVPPEQMEALFTGYPDIFFGFTIRIAEHVIRTDQTAFSTLHNNRAPVHTSADFAPLKYCTRLEALDLGHNAVTDIHFLEHLTDIKILIIALNRVEDITPLRHLKKLQYAELFRNQIRDISVLAELPELLDLNLCYNRIQDFTPLYGLQKLERLWLYKAEGYGKSITFDKQKLQQLKAALPNTYIDAKTYSTGGGWREHPRYFVLFDVFKDSVYQPFAPMEGPWKP